MIERPACEAISSTVMDSRKVDQTVRRRRRCTKCGERWSTYEISESSYQAVTEVDAILARAQDAMRQAADDLGAARADGRLVAEDYDLDPKARAPSSPFSVPRP